MRNTLAALVLALAPGTPAAADCQLALALALDVSSSVDAHEYALQRDGLAAALTAPKVRRALLANPLRWTNIAVYEWSGRTQQAIVLDWTPIRSAEALDRVIAQIRSTQRSYTEFPTAVGYALAYGAGLMSRAPACERQVIDVSSDGINNDGFSPLTAYAHFPLARVTVNALVILEGNAGLVEFFSAEVIRGPGAFVEIAPRFEGFERAMARKLFREISSFALSGDTVEPGGG